jgi:cyanophycinase
MSEEFLRLAGGKKARIVVIPSATPWASGRAASNRWRALGAETSVLHVKSKQEAADPKLYTSLDNATGVWFGGGDQGLLADLFAGTPLVEKLKAILTRGGAVGGFSAGASVVTKVMVRGRGESEGFGLLEDLIIDQHFTQRKRLGRLERLIDKHPKMVGYGIDESTALILSEGVIRVLGDGAVTRCKVKEQPIRLTKNGPASP